MGDGTVCFGNLMERLVELNTEPGGAWTGQLSAAIALFSQTPSAVHTSQVGPRLTSASLSSQVLFHGRCRTWDPSPPSCPSTRLSQERR